MRKKDSYLWLSSYLKKVLRRPVKEFLKACRKSELRINEGCCGKLTCRYYVLPAGDQEFKNKFFFYARRHCAEAILKLIGLSSLPYFNSFNSIGNNEKQTINSALESKNQKINPINQELINAIHVIALAWGYPPPGSALNIIDFTKRDRMNLL